jgi:multiple sugar transport system permease protein
MAALVSPHRAKRWATTTTLYGLVAMVAMWLMGPFVWLFITSISNQRDLMVRPMPLIPPTLNLDNYAQILNLVQSHSAHQSAQILPSLINSVIVTVIVTVINVVLGSAAGYAYARSRSKLMSISLYAILFTRMLPVIVLMPSMFLIMRQLGFQNTLSGLVLAYCSFTFPFTIWIMKAYFETLPRELEESGMVDGCTRFQVFRLIILPISGPGLVAAGAFTFVLCWNEFLVAQILNSKQGTTMLPSTIAGMLGQANIDYSLIAAAGFLSAIPAAILALVFQRYMVQGLTAGSVKG